MFSYFSVRGHLIADWVLQSVMLACTRFCGSHTADAIAEQFDRTTAMFDLTNKILSIVRDNAANMFKAFWLQGFEDVAVPGAISDDSIDGDDDDDDDNALSTVVSNNSLWVNVSEHVSCFVHTLQLVIKDRFKHVNATNKVLDKTAVIMSHARKSIHAGELLHGHQRLQADNAT